MRKTGHTTNHNQKPTELSDGEPELVRPSDNPAMVLIFKHKAHFSKIEDWGDCVLKEIHVFSALQPQIPQSFMSEIGYLVFWQLFH